MSKDDSNSAFRRFLVKLEVDKSPSSFAPPGSHWSNHDLDPVPPEKRVWTMLNYFTYWMSDAFRWVAFEYMGLSGFVE